jgi:hypothetical protein
VDTLKAERIRSAISGTPTMFLTCQCQLSLTSLMLKQPSQPQQRASARAPRVIPQVCGGAPLPAGGGWQRPCLRKDGGPVAAHLLGVTVHDLARRCLLSQVEPPSARRSRTVRGGQTLRSAPTASARSVLLMMRRSDCVTPGPPLRGTLSPPATSTTCNPTNRPQPGNGWRSREGSATAPARRWTHVDGEVGELARKVCCQVVSA